MQTSVDLPENVLNLNSSTRVWSGVTVIHAQFTCAGRVMYEVPFEDESRIGLILEEVGAYRSEPRLNRDIPCRVHYKPRQVNFVPAGMTIWGYSGDIRYARDVRMCFNSATLREACHLEKVRNTGDVPLLRFSDDHIATMMKLLADVVDDPDPSVQLYGDALIAALAIRMFGRADLETKRTPRLSPMQLRNAVSFLEANLPLRVDLNTLASLAGLSPSYYNRAFKAATGLAPYQWQLQARIERAQALLLSANISLDDVAEATGFADAVHFGRTFRKLTGATPSAWRKARVS
ncbi:AraC family transcriptional regulator [Variovorax paradoxus]|jgi:AraC family transcriptional regulator|uniref:helix-turn-helix domain-containing protein n=1 Tax=Variovorax paradoxus TaxID=34073 RepID=UPI00278E327E|nr:AraC family transcriptional regulator [Variovorax paradoxus]MDQ0572592.1 AraC family transcriptional regulator [Variovorax paradoxus]